MKHLNIIARTLFLSLASLGSHLSGVAHAQLFFPVDHHLPNVAFGSLAMGDYDNDGDLDAALVGFSSSSEKIGAVYLNDGSGAFQPGPSLPAVSPGRVCWADYDRDGDLDLFINGTSGNTGSEVVITRLLKNNSGVLIDSGIALPALSANALALADFDGDGDPDLVIGGASNNVSVTYLLWNQGNQFTQSGLELPGLLRGATLAPVDCDADNDMDLLMTPVRFGDQGFAEFGTLVLVNKGDGTFDRRRITADTGVGITAAWHDFDMDGHLDLTSAGSYNWHIAHYDTMFDTWRGSTHTSLSEVQVAVGDYDRDGRPDMIAMGRSVAFGSPATVLARNLGVRIIYTDWENPEAGLAGAWLGDVAFADVDGDSTLDIVQIGANRFGERLTKVYHNNLAGSFQLPAIPNQLSHAVAGSSATLRWQGPGGASTFNVRIGTTPGGANIVAPMSDSVTGRRRLAALGNAAQARTFRIQGLSPGRYYWSVQSIDPAYNGSAFAPEREFIIGNSPQTPRLSMRVDIRQNTVVLNLSGAMGRAVAIQRSFDLQNWHDEGAPMNADQEFSFPRFAESKVFFRARVVP